MSGFLKFLFLCILAVAAGIAAVSFPIEGKTAAEHVRGLVEGGLQPAKKAKPEPPPAKGSPPRMARQRPSEPPADRPPADNHSEEDRRALERLIGEKVR